MHPFVALTDKAWFDYLASRATDGRVDEVNFWSPLSLRPMKRMTPGEPVFLRLKSPFHAIAGYGFFAHFAVVGLDEAWRDFGWRNGDPNEIAFVQRLGRYRGLDLLDGATPRAPLACTVLRDVRFWPREAWMPWGAADGFARNVVRGRSETDPVRAAALLARVARDAEHVAVEAEFAPEFRPLDLDERARRATESVVREGQGAFRARLLDAYGRRCAVTGERTEPVLDAAHIQPYLGPASNHPKNGLVLTKEFHTLFDLGLVGVTPNLEVLVSSQIAGRWSNGRRFYEYAGRPLVSVPRDPAERPSEHALAWHRREVYRP